MHGNQMRSISPFIYKSFLFTGLIILCFLMGNGQSGYRSGITAGVNRKVIALGEQFELILSYSHPVAELPKKTPYVSDTFPHFEVIDRRKADTAIDGDMKTIRQVFVVTSFDTGHWSIPPFVLVSGKNNISSDSIGIDITPVPLSSGSYHDIKEIIDVPDPPFDWQKWLGILITAVIVAAAVWYCIKNRRKPAAVASRFDSKLSPFDQALQDLARLKEEALPEKGEMKKYYTALGVILRVFLERQVKPGFMQSPLMKY